MLTKWTEQLWHSPFNQLSGTCQGFETILSNGYVKSGLPNKTVIAGVQDFICYILNRSALIYSLGNLQWHKKKKTQGTR